MLTDVGGAKQCGQHTQYAKVLETSSPVSFDLTFSYVPGTGHPLHNCLSLHISEYFVDFGLCLVSSSALLIVGCQTILVKVLDNAHSVFHGCSIV